MSPIIRALLIILGLQLSYTFAFPEQAKVQVAPLYKSDSPEAISLIPYPARIDWGKGELRACGSLVIDNHQSIASSEQENLAAELRHINSSFPKNAAGNTLAIHLKQLDDQWKKDNPEAYTITIPPQGQATIAARSFSGYFNALQTLRQLIVRKSGACFIPNCSIQDAPAFPIRGVMLDTGRYFMSVSFIKEIARNLSAYKINLIHLHLTDNPAWRVQIDKYPELVKPEYHWKTRLPGKYYTKDELKDLVQFCAKLNIRIIPEIDMPGHSESFAKATGVDMQSEKGISILKDVVDEMTDIFPDPWFHMGSDEVHVKMKNFIPEMASYIRNKGRDIIVWHPGAIPDDNAIFMCWGENEASHHLKKGSRIIDCNGFYLDWMDAQSGVYQIFFQQPCEMPESNGLGLGGIMAVWCDGALSNERRILEQYPFYPCTLTFAERLWRGAAEKRKDLMAQLPPKGTREWQDFSDFEDRLVFHRDHFFRKQPFSYVKQANIPWQMIGPFNHHGKNDLSFGPEHSIEPSYQDGDRTLSWIEQPAYGGAIHIRHLFAMFNAHRKIYRLNHWPTLMSSSVGKDSGTCYALNYIDSPKDQDIYLMFGLNGMWGHSGGYRTARAPEQGSWDFSGGDVWINRKRIVPPHWPFKSLPWTGWGRGRIEEAPLTQEGYFFRPPVPIHLKKGLNEVLVKSVAGPWKGENSETKWFFCCIPVLWDGLHYREVPGLKFDLPGQPAQP